MGAVDLVVQVESPGAVARGLQRIGRAGHRWAAEPRPVLPKFRGDLLEAAVVAAADARRRGRGDALPGNPLDVLAQQIVAMGAVDEWRVDELARGASARRELRGAVRGRVHRGARHAGRALPVRRVRRAAAAPVWDRGPATSARARARAGSRSSTAARSRSRALRRVPRGRPARWRARRGDGVREPAGEIFLLGASTWRIEESRATASSSRRRPASRARCRSGTATSPAVRSSSAARGAFTRELRGPRGRSHGCATRTGSTRSRRETWSPTSASSRRRPAGSPTTAPSCRAFPRRARRLAGLHPVPVRRSASTRRGRHGARGAAGRAGLRRAGCGATTASCCACPTPRTHPAGRPAVRSRRDRGPAWWASCRAQRSSRRPFREARRARCCCRGAGPASARRCGRSGSAAELLGVARASGVPDHAGDHSRVPARRLRPAGAGRGAGANSAGGRPHRPVDTGELAVRPVAGVRLCRRVPVRGRRAARRAQAPALTLDRNLLRELLGPEELRELLTRHARRVEAELQRLAEGAARRNGDDVHDLLRRSAICPPDELAARRSVDPCRVDRAVRRRLDSERSASRGRRRRADRGRGRAAFRDALGVALPPGLPAAFLEPTPRHRSSRWWRAGRAHMDPSRREAATPFGLLPA